MTIRIITLALAVMTVSCGGGDTGDRIDSGDGLFPDVVAATMELEPDGTFRVDATLSSPYDSASRYADAWRVVAPDGSVLGVRELAHDHASEQPFTRSLSAVEIADDVNEVTIEGRDQINGWGGLTVTIPVPHP